MIEEGVYKTELLLGLADSEPLLLPAVIFFDYDPAEPMTRDYPGCSEQVTITGLGCAAINSHLMATPYWDELQKLIDTEENERLILEAIHTGEEE